MQLSTYPLENHGAYNRENVNGLRICSSSDAMRITIQEKQGKGVKEETKREKAIQMRKKIETTIYETSQKIQHLVYNKFTSFNEQDSIKTSSFTTISS